MKLFTGGAWPGAGRAAVRRRVAAGDRVATLGGARATIEINLTADSNATSVAALIENVTFENVSESPATHVRAVRLVLETAFQYLDSWFAKRLSSD